MTTAQQIAGIEAVIAELQAIQDKADKFCDGMPYGTISRYCRMTDAIDEAKRHARTTINLLRAQNMGKRTI